MPTYHTLVRASDGLERSLGKWNFNLESCIGTKYNQAPDTWEAIMSKTASAVGTADFAFESLVSIYSNRTSSTGADNSFAGGILKFRGYAQPAQWNYAGGSFSARYEFRGPWYALENTQYQQTYKGISVNPYNPGEVILNTSLGSKAFPTSNLVYISLGDQIQDILQFVIDQYVGQGMAAPFQYKGRTLHSTVDPSAPTGFAIDLSLTGGGTYVYPVVASPTIDTPLFGVTMPSYVGKPMTSAEAIKKCLELSPRTSVAFDYTTTPPTIYIKSVDNFSALTFPLFNGPKYDGTLSHQAIQLRSRDDLIARAVKLVYRTTNNISGQEKLDYTVDKWGPHGSNSALDPDGGLRVVVDTIDLAGYSISYSSATLDCELLACIGGTTASKRAWWAKSRGAEMKGFVDSKIRFQSMTQTGTATSPTWSVAAAAIPDATLSYASDGVDTAGVSVLAGQSLTSADLAFYTYRIIGGSHHSWMKVANVGPAVKSLKVHCKCSFTYAEYDSVVPGDTVGQLPANETTVSNTIGTDRTPSGGATQSGKTMSVPIAQDHHFEMQLTNGTSGTYTTISSVSPGETYVLGANGIAFYLFNALNVLQYESNYIGIGTGFTAVSMLNRINFSGGATPWLTMSAQVNSIRENYGTNTTQISLGPAKHLSAQQLSTVLNMWRNRRPWYNPQVRNDNTQTNGGQVSMPVTAGGGNTTRGVSQDQAKIYFSDGGTTPVGTITLDPTLIVP